MNHAQERYGLHATCFEEWFDANSIDEFENVARKESISKGDPSLQSPEYWNSSFFHGKFLKYAADLAGKSYIIKLQEEEAPELPFVEYLCNQIANNLGMKIPPYHLIMFHGKPAFVTQNLLGKHADIKSLVHIYHYVEIPENYNCETLVKIIHAQTQNMRDIDNFVDICLFDGLIGNHDRHGRNLGLIIDAYNKSLCPVYDNTSVLGLEQGEILKANFSPRGKIATEKSNEPTLKDYVQDFLRLGHRNIVVDFYHRIKMNEIEALIEMSLCSDLMKSAFSKLIKSRYAEITDAIQD
ncbi:MAG: HipA domain-containing protein [Gammaproteobacteria bacterium]